MKYIVLTLLASGSASAASSVCNMAIDTLVYSTKTAQKQAVELSLAEASLSFKLATKTDAQEDRDLVEQKRKDFEFGINRGKEFASLAKDICK